MPHNPSIAVSLRTLEHYCLIRLRKPSFSIEAFSKVICDSYSIPFHRMYCTILSEMFDIYLSILQDVDRQVSVALGRDSPDWRVLNACPPCSYELRMYDFINTFSHEVRTCPTPAEPVPLHNDPDNEDLAVSDIVNNVNATDCSKNWKAAASDEKKRMWAIFEETGIFVGACRHGLILWYTDMMRSGELAKYLLAIVAKVLAIIGNHTLGAYNIGCGFSAMVKASSLGPAFTEQESHLCIDSFHRFATHHLNCCTFIAHNYICQTQHHPLRIEGAGLEDFGATKHIFSASNVLAPVIRYASSYRHHWDEEKYMNLGTMLLNNYCQALHIISTDTLALREAMASLNIQQGNIEQWHSEEIEYFHALRQEPEWDVHAVVYVELLQQLQEADAQASAGFTSFVSTAPENYQFRAPSDGESNFYAANLSQMHKLETQRQCAAERLDATCHDVVTMEVKLGITHCWQPSSLEYQETLKYMCVCKYHKALDNLQCLVVQCLFELQRLNVSQTACCHAIQNAVQKYNDTASELQPLFLEEFNLLHETQQDIRNKPWAKPAIQETMCQHLHILRAKEEILRCNVEVRRLQTAISAEDQMFVRTLASLKALPIYVAVDAFCTQRCHINVHILSCITQIQALEGFTGDTSCGIRVGGGGGYHPS
ncbi:uncharacterized protein F5147DRAFT_746939 [Suillus discolor]|uniref:Uncharacterized protein n=1 Tax=Suillus discolor TaxID=1912936 RepID=A0A9P7JR39_9AGAM|nr:uncharacterized protein F5147DRAFT_746939 [Suillus discolor]KAG2101883.1 hypothetical protein F5147DRAFT_746939 [Suillus discolor]